MSAPDAALPRDELGGSPDGDAGVTARFRAPSPARAAAAPAAHGAEPGDAALLARARAGDRAAFGVLVERHHRALAAILRPRCGRDVPMEDLLQEVFARALANVGGFRGGSAFLTWAASIGLHLATDWRRTAERRRRLAPPVDAYDAEPPCPRAGADATLAERRDSATRARRALDELPDAMRIAVTLRVVEEEDYESIAARMGAPLPRVRQWVCRGLRRLRDSLDGDAR